MARIAIWLLLCVIMSGVSRATDCTKPPFGDAARNYKQFVLNGEVASKGNLALAEVLAGVEKSELQSACEAKFNHHGDAVYRKMGLSSRAMARLSVTQIAAYSMKWHASQGRMTVSSRPRRISVEQFEIDAPRLVREHAKVIIRGAYVRVDDAEYLYANSNAVVLSTVPGYEAYQPHIALATDNATKEARTEFLGCSENPASAQMGCAVTITGIATKCDQTTAFGGRRVLPCIDVRGVEH